MIVCGIYRPLFGFANVGVTAVIGDREEQPPYWVKRLSLT